MTPKTNFYRESYVCASGSLYMHVGKYLTFPKDVNVHKMYSFSVNVKKEEYLNGIFPFYTL